jgi:DinB superfamily
MNMDANEVLRKQLLALLRGGNAHMSLDEAVADFPMEAINRLPPNGSYPPWHLLEHLRRAQKDILDFIRDPKYVSPPWPEGYWPAKGEQADEAQWNETITRFHADLDSLEALVENQDTNLTADLPHAPGYTILREILTVTDHNAYHIGEFAILRQVMGTWPAAH